MTSRRTLHRPATPRNMLTNHMNRVRSVFFCLPRWHALLWHLMVRKLTLPQPGGTSLCARSVAAILLSSMAMAPAAWAMDASPAIALGKSDGRILRFQTEVDSIVIADESVADVQIITSRSAYLFGKSIGTTRITALDARQNVVTDTEVRVGTGATEDPVQERAAGRRVVASGSVKDLSAAVQQSALLAGHADSGVQSVNMMTQSDLPQINLRVRFAEVSRQELLVYGVNWSALFNSGSFSFGLVTGGPLGTGQLATNTISGGFRSGSANIDLLLDALQSNGVLEILAEPNITTVTGRTASFLAGGEIPVPVPVNRDMIGIDYKPYGVSLVFTPTLLPNDRISLQVRPEVSTLSSAGLVEIAGVNVPSFSVRRADTQVEMASGQTFAIAGLFQRNGASDIDKLPVLGDIPILGQLFQSKRFQRNETELVILITPYLVRPVSGKSSATPLDASRENPARLVADSPAGLQNASDFGFYVY